jgi:hypothetical protein
MDHDQLNELIDTVEERRDEMARECEESRDFTSTLHRYDHVLKKERASRPRRRVVRAA